MKETLILLKHFCYGGVASVFFIHHIKGSHYYPKHPERPQRRVTLPYRSGDLKRRTLLSIVDQAGFSIGEFLDLL
ncbi:MAG: type II toxin-antitoxin system HicA family toxin [Acidobacteriaceae bacterium]